jgi:hypothetical protein
MPIDYNVPMSSNPYRLPNGAARSRKWYEQQMELNRKNWMKESGGKGFQNLSPERQHHYSLQETFFQDAMGSPSPTQDEVYSLPPTRADKIAEERVAKEQAAFEARLKQEELARKAQHAKKQLPHAVEGWRQGMENTARIGLVFTRKEKEIGRKLTPYEKNFYLQNGEYPAANAKRLDKAARDADFQHLDGWSKGEEERRRRIKEARGRTPLESAIRNLFTPYSKQVPKKYLTE